MTLLVPAFIATANIVRHNRMRPIFVDVDPLTYNMDVEELAKAIDNNKGEVRCVIPVHMFGQPADMSGVRSVIGNKNILIVEDSAECMFARHNGQSVGSMGDIGCFSTYVAHIIVTGVGGICTTNNADYAAKIRSLVNHGLMIAQLNPDDNFAPRPTPGRRFRFESYGHSFRITELEAALGLAQLKNPDIMVRIRQRNANHMTAGLTIINRNYDDPFQLPTVLPGNTWTPMMYPILLNKKDDQIVDKEPLMEWLNEHGVETRDMPTILGSPIYKWVSPEDYPISEWIWRSGFYCGVHQALEPSDIQYVIQTIEEWTQTQ